VTDHEIRHLLRTALGRFVTNDSKLLERNVGERAIAGALARYIAGLFPDHNVDTQYDRHGLEPKTLNLPGMCRGGGPKRVVPDIVIHRRGTDDSNLLAVEIKKETNTEPRDCDRAKLRGMRERFGYRAAVLLDVPAGPGAKGGKTKVEWTNRDPRTNTIKRQPR
jgi:hypothetical protein